jgi:hypothetical protein
MRKAILNLLLLVAVFAAGAAAMEIGIRLLFPIYDPSGQVRFKAGADGRPALGEPGTSVRQTKLAGDYDVAVTINAYGFRDRRDIATGTESDLYVVGDSFSFGWGVEAADRYSNQLEELTGTRTFNISIPGNFDQYGKLLRHARDRGAEIRHIVVGICMENDLGFYDAAPAQPGPSGPAPAHGSYLRTIKEFLTQHSALYKLIASQVHRNPALRAAALKLGLIADIEKSVPGHSFDPSVISASVTRLWELIAPYNATLLIIPSRALWIGDGQQAAARSHDAFVKALAPLGAPIIDMRPVFEASGNPLQYHFKNDGHWTAEAHALAAREIHKILNETQEKASQ